MRLLVNKITAKMALTIWMVFLSGCTFRTMDIHSDKLVVVSKQSVERYEKSAWVWGEHYITDEILKVTILSDKNLLQYSIESKQQITVSAFFCGNKDNDYPIFTDLYVGGKSLSFWENQYIKNESQKPETLEIWVNNKAWYKYDLIFISEFIHDVEAPNFSEGNRKYYSKYDLRAAPADLCLKLNGYAGGFSREESNVLVIKKEEIKKVFKNYKP